MVQVRFARWNSNRKVWVLALVASQSLFPSTSITVWENTSPLEIRMYLWTLKKRGGVLDLREEGYYDQEPSRPNY